MFSVGDIIKPFHLSIADYITLKSPTAIYR